MFEEPGNLVRRHPHREKFRYGILSSGFVFYGLEESPNVAVLESESLLLARVPIDLRGMVRHDHSVVADLLIDPHCPHHVDAAIIREGLLKVQEVPVNVAEMDIEDFTFLAKVPDDVENLFVRGDPTFRSLSPGKN